MQTVESEGISESSDDRCRTARDERELGRAGDERRAKSESSRSSLLATLVCISEERHNL